VSMCVLVCVLHMWRLLVTVVLWQIFIHLISTSIESHNGDDATKDCYNGNTYLHYSYKNFNQFRLVIRDCIHLRSCCAPEKSCNSSSNLWT
jgi:hypothetical protein